MTKKDSLHVIELAVRMHKRGEFSEQETIQYITEVAKNGKIFNWYSFRLGMLIAAMIYLIAEIIK